jgi:hypothetical protein
MEFLREGNPLKKMLRFGMVPRRSEARVRRKQGTRRQLELCFFESDSKSTALETYKSGGQLTIRHTATFPSQEFSPLPILLHT